MDNSKRIKQNQLDKKQAILDSFGKEVLTQEVFLEKFSKGYDIFTEDGIRRFLEEKNAISKAEQNQLSSLKMVYVRTESDIKPFFVGENVEKGKKVPVGTVSNGKKKVAEGKWVDVKDEKKGSKKEELTPGDIDKMNVKNLEKLTDGYMGTSEYKKFKEAKSHADNWGKVTPQNKAGYDNAERQAVQAFKKYKDKLKSMLKKQVSKKGK